MLCLEWERFGDGLAHKVILKQRCFGNSRTIIFLLSLKE